MLISLGCFFFIIGGINLISYGAKVAICVMQKGVAYSIQY